MGYTKFDANTLAHSTTNAAFQAWGSWISTAIANSGIVKVTGVGEVDWSTVAAPTAPEQFPAYEIWRFDDVLHHSTAPVFFKLEYGASGYGADTPAMAITVGSGFDTTLNTLTGICSTRESWQCISKYTNAALLSYACGDNNRFVVAYAANGVNSNNPTLAATYGAMHGFGIERSVDLDGNVTDEAVLLTARAENFYYQVAWNCRSGQYTNWTNNGWRMNTPAKGTVSNGSVTGVFPLFHTKKTFMNPGYNWLGYDRNDFSANTEVAVYYYGAEHTFITLGYATYTDFRTRLGDNCCAMIRWE